MTRGRLRIAVIQGGESTEAEVSRASANGVAQALRESGHEVVRLELDAHLAESLRTGAYDVVFPVVHGAVGEDGSLQGLLEVLELPYVGSSVLASALAMNKAHARRVFAENQLPVAKGIAFAKGDAYTIAKEARERIGQRLVIKPCSGGSGIGVTRLDESASLSDAATALETTWQFDDVAIVEHFARGKEVTCGVVHLHSEAPRAFPPTEILSPHDAFYTYEARYAPGRSVHRCPAPFADELLAEIQRIAIGAHVALGCRDLSRADFVVGDDDAPENVTLLEVNTIPGFTKTSLYPEAAGVAGISMTELCDQLARSARARGTPKRNAPRPLPK